MELGPPSPLLTTVAGLDPTTSAFSPLYDSVNTSATPGSDITDPAVLAPVSAKLGTQFTIACFDGLATAIGSSSGIGPVLNGPAGPVAAPEGGATFLLLALGAAAIFAAQKRFLSQAGRAQS